ncbi:CHAT domain-containing protein [Ephemerocybe angulata]|uniref:CHAT domain-containing protein n=1 Tax=Ephemerocybe angulata TaxID=980116 RepID=A0A8H6LXS6_9AGAR|nr:CHAT domain-containing protein [Tulosesus angulatus]
MDTLFSVVGALNPWGVIGRFTRHLYRSFYRTVGIYYMIQFAQGGSLVELDVAVSAHQEAVRITPLGTAALPVALKNLGDVLQLRFTRTGPDLSDISEAILAYQRAVELTPEDHPNLRAFLRNLGVAYMARSGHTGDLQDVAEGIAAIRRSLELTPEGHVGLPRALANYGSAHLQRFGQTGDVSDLSEVISSLRRAGQLTPEGHQDLPTFLNILGSSLGHYHEQTGDLKSIDEAILVHRRAVELTPAGSPTLPHILNGLGNALHHRFERIGDIDDISESIEAQQKALKLAPAGQTTTQRSLTRLALAFLSRFERMKGIGGGQEEMGGQRQDDLDTSISLFRQIATCTTFHPRARGNAARRWATLLRDHYPQSNDIMLAWDTATELIVLSAGLEQTLQSRFTHLQAFAGVPMAAASSACLSGRPDKALEWLEQGRCLVWAQLNNLRTPLDELRLYDSALAERIAEVSKQLEVAQGASRGDVGIPLAIKMAEEDGARNHQKLAKDWEDLLRTVRELPGFENFLRPSPCSTLLQHLYQSREQPIHIPLPEFSYEKATKYRDDLGNLLKSNHLRDRGSQDSEITATGDDDPEIRAVRLARREKRDGGVLHGILRSLWSDLVKPILDRLGISKVEPSTSTPPRIWWCPTGPLTFLPIHAAGIYSETGSESAMKHVISSYTPSISALTDRVKNSCSVDKAVSGLFLTSQPNAPEASSIPGTTKEVEAIYDMAVDAGTRVVKAEGSEVTIETCLEYFETFSSIHLACHASQNAADPLRSRLLLHDGPLDLSTVIQRNLKNADLAFLSACQTSTGEEKLPDEAVHLAAGMLAAGYRRVVASMWSIGDQHAREVAADFYSYLWREGRDLEDEGSAYALHHATRELKSRLDNSEQSLLAWIPYVHFGY